MQFLRVILLALAAACAAFPVASQAVESFVIEDIQLEGLRRISPGAVFVALPVRVGDRMNEERSGELIRALFATGFFNDIDLRRDGNVLVIELDERPSIASINFAGNESVKSEDLLEGLRQIDLAPGRVFVPSALDGVEQELQRQYFSQGRYGVQIETAVDQLERNRVAINIEISEGEVARIRQINIIGNEVYDDDELLGLFNLSTPNLFSFFTGNDRYSRQKLTADLESLRSFYLNEGYLDFTIASTQVAITPDKREMYITVNVDEGQQYTVSEVRLSGNLIVVPEALVALVQIHPGDTFSREKVTRTTDLISARLADEGYAFANVNAIPEVDKKNGRVAMTLFVDPGKRVYVRRINFSGNSKTQDDVLRREMRQMEAAAFSGAAVDRSRVRLERLGFFDTVSVETPSVPGSPDLVDVNFAVVERPSGTISAGLGFAQNSGLIINASITQDNFLGSGDRVSVSLNRSAFVDSYSLSFTDPYFTVDGISRTLSVFYRSTDAGDVNLSDFDTESFGGSIGFAVPVDEFNEFSWSLGYEHTEIAGSFFSAREINDFIRDNGREYDLFRFNFAVANDTRNRALFPTRGGLQRLGLEATMPFSDLEFYKLVYRRLHYFPITDNVTLMLSGQLGYGDGYGDTDELPFFENFFAGGYRSVRGFENNSLGPRASDDDPFGGDTLVTGRTELFFPVPFLDQQSNSFRLSLFLDAGNVYGLDDNVDAGDLRYSVGLGAVWLSPFGPLTVSFAQPFNKGGDDEVERFQFNLGGAF